MKKDFYATLGVSQSASSQEIKTAYRKLAMKYHPDRNPGNKETEQKFKEINSAYDILKDPQKKATYDQYGQSGFDTHSKAQQGFGSFGDIFEEMFADFGGGGRHAPQAQTSQRGADLRYDLEIDLENAFSGLTKKINVSTYATCTDCRGTGSEKGAPPDLCKTCGGRGRLRSQQGFFTVERTCSACQGMGQTMKNTCYSCRGLGRQREKKILNVSIPAGVENGTRIRLSGEGEVGVRGGGKGDLYVYLSVHSHHFFKRDGEMVACQATIPMTTAILGGSIEVPTIDGKTAIVKIPEGTQSGKEFRLKSKGMPVLRQMGRGDMYVRVLVETPVNLSTEQKELLKTFDQLSAARQNSPQSGRFFNKIKDFFKSFLLCILFPF